MPLGPFPRNIHRLSTPLASNPQADFDGPLNVPETPGTPGQTLVPLPFRLRRPVRPDADADPVDLERAHEALDALGHLDLGGEPAPNFATGALIDGIKSFQAVEGLEVDGIMKEEGPTVDRLRTRLIQLAESQERAAKPRAHLTSAGLIPSARADTPGLPNQGKSQSLPPGRGTTGDRAKQRARDRERAKTGVGRSLKGTTFFGGAGMNGGYIDDMVKALEEAGVGNVRAADPRKWSRGDFVHDGIAVPFLNQRDRKPSDLSGFGEEGEQFNLIGYSFGGLQAAQAAADYADRGGKVDNLVLLGAPIEREFLEQLQNNPNIKSVKIIDLTEHGDPIKAGMSDVEVLLSTPELGVQFVRGMMDDEQPKPGHFRYSGLDEQSRRLRRALAKQLVEQGLK